MREDLEDLTAEIEIKFAHCSSLSDFRRHCVCLRTEGITTLGHALREGPRPIKAGSGNLRRKERYHGETSEERSIKVD